MRISEQWLREWSNPKLTTKELVNTLTMAGLEVESYEPVAGVFSGVVIGQVLQVDEHPQADRLRVCQVTITANMDELLTIVCGADNVRKGLKVAVAKIGARLPKDLKIKLSKIRGIESQGMICSEIELGLSEAGKGIMELSPDAPIGVDLREYLLLDDVAIEVSLTPNRGDCLSVMGIARELSALTKIPWRPNSFTEVKALIPDTLPIKLQAPKACPRYIGRIIRNINAEAHTPVWMLERLRRSGLRPLNPVVDVANYVMLELGHPLHTFDLDPVHKEINVRFAAPNEKLILLNGQTVALKNSTLVIADANKPLAIAGIMGGQETAITTNSKNVFIESAFFRPEAIAGQARFYNLQTDAAMRYERGVDPTLQRFAIERASKLLLEIVGGEPGPIHEVSEPNYLPERLPIKLTKKRITKYLGMTIEEEQASDILNRLHFEVKETADELIARPPSFRFDISQDVDLIEEIVRVYGYQNIPSTVPQGLGAAQLPSETKISTSILRERLVTLGYQEAITYSFVDAKLQSMLEPEEIPLALLNPITADLSVMRTSLWPGLISALLYNRNRQQKRVRLFETGLRFRQQDGSLKQEPMLGGLCLGLRFPEQWGHGKQEIDFFDVKGDIEALLRLTGQPEKFSFESYEHTALHPGQTARILLNEQAIGIMGALHPRINQQLECEEKVYLFELLLEPILNSILPEYKALSKYPSIRRDIAIVVPESELASTICQAIKEVGGKFLKDLVLFDLYQGMGIPKGQKSIALGLIWQHEERTLTDEEVNEFMDQVLRVLQTRFAAILRK